MSTPADPAPRCSRRKASTHKLSLEGVSGDDLDTDVSNVRLSRIFAVVLALHVLAIGGFMVFELVRDKSPQTSPSRSKSSSASSSSKPKPAAPAPSATRPSLTDSEHGDCTEYLVGSGETLATIAARTGITEEEIRRLNRLDEFGLQSGSKILLPPGATVKSGGDPTSHLAGISLPDPEKSSPAVNSEDRLSKPALPAEPADAGTTQKEIPMGKPVRPAELVDTPREPARPRESADTPKAPAPRTPAPRARIAEGEVKKETRESSGSNGKAVGVVLKTHVVTEGDTAYNIAKRNGIKLDDFLKYNKIDPTKIHPGQVLKIPAKK